MTYCCEKIFNGMYSECKNISVVTDSKINKIVYYKFFKCKEDVHLDKKISFIDNIEDALINRENPLDANSLENVTRVIKKVYNSLKKQNKQHKTLEVVTATCVNHLDININCSRGILVEDGSIVIFQDFSLEQKAYLESIIKKGTI